MYTSLNSIPYTGPAIDLGVNSGLINDTMENILHPFNAPLSPFIVPAGPLAQADGDSGNSNSSSNSNTGLYIAAALAAYFFLK